MAKLSTHLYDPTSCKKFESGSVIKDNMLVCVAIYIIQTLAIHNYSLFRFRYSACPK